MALWKKNLILLIIVVLISAIPLLTLKNAEFAGADGLAETAVTELAPDYKPWFSPIYEPASTEIESLLFALQAAIGAGIMGFILGRITAKKGE